MISYFFLERLCLAVRVSHRRMGAKTRASSLCLPESGRMGQD